MSSMVETKGFFVEAKAVKAAGTEIREGGVP